jgi:ABC-type phosphate/phosphonate transport system ATPase subunit
VSPRGRSEPYPDQRIIQQSLFGLSSWEIMDVLFEKAAQRGILILLDLHILDPKKGYAQLWYERG